MKYYPFASLEVAKFKSLLKFAQRLGAFSILALYLTLLIAALVFFSQSGQSSALQANQVLMLGVGISGCGLAISGLIALFLNINHRQVA